MSWQSGVCVAEKICAKVRVDEVGVYLETIIEPLLSMASGRNSVPIASWGQQCVEAFEKLSNLLED